MSGWMGRRCEREGVLTAAHPDIMDLSLSLADASGYAVSDEVAHEW